MVSLATALFMDFHPAGYDARSEVETAGAPPIPGKSTSVCKYMKDKYAVNKPMLSTTITVGNHRFLTFVNTRLQELCSKPDS